jgi:hypothetical protein
MKQTLTPKDNQVLLVLWAYPNMLRPDDSGVDIIQKLPYFAQIIDDLRSLIWAIANE